MDMPLNSLRRTRMALTGGYGGPREVPSKQGLVGLPEVVSNVNEVLRFPLVSRGDFKP